MKPFSPNGTVMMIVNLVLELEEKKKENVQLKADKRCLSELIQIKQRFEVRV